MNRRGMTLLELSALIGISSLVLGGVGAVLGRLQRLAAADRGNGVRSELACDQLRRDLAGGVPRPAADGLDVQRGPRGIRWRLAAGELQRDGRPMLAATAFTAATADGWLVVTIAPRGLPARRIEVRP